FRNLPTRRRHCENREAHARPEQGSRATVRCCQTGLALQRPAQSQVRQDQAIELLLLRNASLFFQPLRAAGSNAPASTHLSSVESRMPSLRPGRCREFRVALQATEKMSG